MTRFGLKARMGKIPYQSAHEIRKLMMMMMMLGKTRTIKRLMS